MPGKASPWQQRGRKSSRGGPEPAATVEGHHVLEETQGRMHTGPAGSRSQYFQFSDTL